MLCGPKKMTYHVWLTGFLGFVSPGGKLEKIQEDSLDSIPSPSHSVKIQIIGGKVCLSYKGLTLLGVVNKLFKKEVC